MNFVTACDVPFLRREMIEHLAHHIAGQDVVVPCRGDAVEPLVGFYSKQCCEAITDSIAHGRLQVRGFWPEVRTEIVDLGHAFRDSDLDTWLLNVNTRNDLEMARALSETWR
jgi:molybdopterin-guanine dinucleotide biosynthesis protein A